MPNTAPFKQTEVTFKQTIASLLSPDATHTIWLAVSGGMDSMVLLDLAHRFLPHKNIRIIHINHNISPNAHAWAQHVQDEAKTRDLMCIVEIAETIDIPRQNLEHNARLFRQRCFNKHLAKNDTLLLAHHQNDQVETVLMRLFEGAGPEGLSGMRTLEHTNDYVLYRPLLSLSKTALHAYAAHQKLVWVEDESNTNTRFKRNHIRHVIQPLLEQHYPHINQTITRSAAHIAQQQDYIEQHIVKPLETYIAKPMLALQVLHHHDTYTQSLILRRWVKYHTGYPPSTKQLSTLVQTVLHARHDKTPVHKHMHMLIRRYKEHLYIEPPCRPHTPTQYQWPAHMASLRLPGSEITLHKPKDYLQQLPYNQPLAVRFRTFGERFHPKGRIGSHPLKKCMQEWHIPPWKRPTVPLIYHQNTLICVVDYAMHDRFRDIPPIFIS